jgi:hypothetical protein
VKLEQLVIQDLPEQLDLSVKPARLDLLDPLEQLVQLDLADPLDPLAKLDPLV